MADDSKKPPPSSSDTPPSNASSNADAPPSSSHTPPPELSNSNAPSPASNSSFTIADDSKKPPTSSSSGTPQPASHIDLSSSVPPAPSKSLLRRSRSTLQLTSESFASESASSINAAATTSSSKPDSPRSADIHKQKEIQLASDSSSRRPQEIQEVSSSSMQIGSAPQKSPSRPRAPYSGPSIRQQQSSPTPEQQERQRQQELLERQEQEDEEEEIEAPNSYCCYITCMIISICAFGFLLSFIVYLFVRYSQIRNKRHH